MNKKQWLVLGVGLIIMGIFLGFISGRVLTDCDILVKDALKRYEEVVDSDMSILEKQAFSPDILIQSCYDEPIMVSVFSSIFWTLGIIFIILGFLEDKKK